MFTSTVLHASQKKAAFSVLKEIPADRLHPILVRAALNNHVFPTPLENGVLPRLKNIYQACRVLPGIGRLIEQAIIVYFMLWGYAQFMNLLNSTFNQEHWNTTFLIYISKSLDLDISIQNDPMIILAIKEGKIYWKFVLGEQVLHDRTARKNPETAFDFEKVKTLSMTWEEFRTFKDAGKRGGTVAITKERFTLQFKRAEHTAAEEIWNELKAKGMLDHNDRLSHVWRGASGTITLSCFKADIDYQDINNALKNISSNRHYTETISRVHPAEIFRPDRSPKLWGTTGHLTNETPKSEHHQIKIWDTGIYANMNLHAKIGDDLEHDHIPSSNFLKKQAATSAAINHAQHENNDNWGCIAITKALHKQGISHSKSSANQEKQITRPFFDEVTDYLDILEMNWQHTLLIDNEYLRALGAFRYLFRCNTTAKCGVVPYRFFNDNPTLKQDIDHLVMDRLERFMNKKTEKLTM